MSYTTTEEFTVLHSLKVRGLSRAEPLASTTGISPSEVQKILDDAVARGLARSRTGRVEGYMLTAAGRERHAALRGHEVSREEQQALAPAYEAFLAPNAEFKKVTSEWQTGGSGRVDDVLPQLAAVHDHVSQVLDDAASVLPRFATYQGRLDSALERLRAGDAHALAKPMSDSYHDVWMELHEDLLLTLARERDEADG